jgi:hypothetical protein
MVFIDSSTTFDASNIDEIAKPYQNTNAALLKSNAR